MSTFRNLVLVALAAVFALGLVVTATATDVYNESNGTVSQLRQNFKDNIRELYGPPMNPNQLPNGSGVRLAPHEVTPGAFGINSTSAPCAFQTNQCPGFENAFIFSTPNRNGAGMGVGSRKAVGTQIINSGLLPESVKTVYVFILWDPLNEEGLTFPTPGTPTLRAELYANGAGVPSGPALASISRVHADWTTDPGLVIDGGTTAALIGYVSFDFSASGVIVPPGGVVHAGVWLDQATPGVDYIWFWGDDGTTSTCTSKSSTYRSSVGAWVMTSSPSDQGLPFNYDIVTETCTEQPPPVCFNQMPHCDPNIAATVTIFGMPRTNRHAFANRFFAGQAGQAQPCTVKTLYPWFYENAAADSADIEIKIYEDDGAGLPGAVVWSDTLPYGSFIMDLSAPTVVAVPDVVVTGEFYVGYTAINPVPAGINRITFVGSLLGDPVGGGCGAYLPNALFVQALPSLAWVDDIAFFGAESELWVSADMCCPALSFATCTPASDPNWETQGNGMGRPNATDASLSSLCGLTYSWTASPGGTCNSIQPLIAGNNVLIAGVDSLHCYDKATGAQNWAFGGFPYIIGDLRGSGTVDDSLVYLGGAGAQAFSCIRLADGSVKWSRNLGGVDVPLSPGITAHTSNVVSGGHVYFTQETGRVYKLDKFTGADAGGSPLLLPDAPGAVPYNSLSSDGSKLWVGTANTVGTNGNIHQIDAATMVIDWTLNSPGATFYPGNAVAYTPEGFPGSLAHEGGILYYHSLIRDDVTPFAHGTSTGSVGAIDVAVEDGSGAGLLWVNDADIQDLAAPGINLSTFNWSGPAIGPGMLYLASRGYLTTDQDGISAWDKTLGARVWYTGYTQVGVSNGVAVNDDIRSDVPATVFCQGGVPYVFTSHVGGKWRLVDGNTGTMVWMRQFSERVRGTALADNCVAVATRTNGVNGSGQGQIVVFTVGGDRPRLQVDSQFVFRTATPGDGVTNDNIVDAIQNTGCINLNVAAYNEVNPPAVRVLGSNPMLAAAVERFQRGLSGYNTLLQTTNPEKALAIMRTAGVDEESEESDNVRTFASLNAKSASDPLFLTVNTAPGAIAPGATQTLNVDYDETGLSNNTGYTNFIEIDSDDPDYFPQDPTGAVFGDPFIQFELFIGCPDAMDLLTTGLGQAWITNFGAEAGGGNFATADADDGFAVNGNDAANHHFDGGWALVVQDSIHWALDGVSTGGYPRRAGHWSPTLPCGLTISAMNYPGPNGPDAVEEVTYNMIDLAAPQTANIFTVGSRSAGGVSLSVKRVGSQDPAFGDFVLTHVNITNELGAPGNIVGAMNNVYFGVLTDWDISTTDNVRNYNDGYAQENNGAGAPGSGDEMDGHVRLDQNHFGAGAVGSGGAPTFMISDFYDQIGAGHGQAAMRMMSNPTGYCATLDPSSCANTDAAALWSGAHWPSIADGASVDFYMAIWRVQDGVNGLPFVAGAAGAEAVYREVTCRAKAFAGFGKGDINCDGCIDLQDVVALGNIVDGLLPAAGASIYTADVNADNAHDDLDYDLLYDVVAGLQPANVLANGWRF